MRDEILEKYLMFFSTNKKVYTFSLLDSYNMDDVHVGTLVTEHILLVMVRL
jgi:hypothetical protein